MKRSKLVLGMLILLTNLNLLDFITMLPSKDIETNPVFLFGGVIGLVVAKVLITILLWFIYIHNKYKSEFSVFCFSFLIVWTSFIMSYFGIFFNITIWLNPEVIETTRNVLASSKTVYYNSIMIFFYVIPFILSSLVYYLHKSNMRYVTIIK